jgi:precorrin-3B C17-methyltransferase
VTPRGYANKYDMQENGATREGEKAGRSLSTGLLGWAEGLRLDHLDGVSVAELALLHRLPQDYIAAVLAEAVAAPSVVSGSAIDTAMAEETEV